MSGLLPGLVSFSKHGCPKIHVSSDYVCLFEYVDAHVGGQAVRDLIPGTLNTPATLVFADGHVMPLLCAHCGKGLHVTDADAALEVIAGQSLVALEYDKEDKALVLVFAPDPEHREGGEAVPVHLESARKLVCPREPHQRRAKRRKR